MRPDCRAPRALEIEALEAWDRAHNDEMLRVYWALFGEDAPRLSEADKASLLLLAVPALRVERDAIDTAMRWGALADSMTTISFGGSR